MRKRDTCLTCGRSRCMHGSMGFGYVCDKFLSNTPANRAKAEKPVDKKPVTDDNPLFPLLGPPQ